MCSESPTQDDYGAVRCLYLHKVSNHKPKLIPYLLWDDDLSALTKLAQLRASAAKGMIQPKWGQRTPAMAAGLTESKY
jgi:hypothetical protein